MLWIQNVRSDYTLARWPIYESTNRYKQIPNQNRRRTFMIQSPKLQKLPQATRLSVLCSLNYMRPMLNLLSMLSNDPDMIPISDFRVCVIANNNTIAQTIQFIAFPACPIWAVRLLSDPRANEQHGRSWLRLCSTGNPWDKRASRAKRNRPWRSLLGSKLQPKGEGLCQNS